MRKHILTGITVSLMATASLVYPANANSGKFYEVVGVDENDMLKMRAGPGVGFSVIVGLPNGTILRNHGCDPVGTIQWCKVSLKQARGLKGYVSKTYLRDH